MEYFRDKIKYLLLAVIIFSAGIVIGLNGSWESEQMKKSAASSVATTTQAQNVQITEVEETNVFYWVPNGEVYHVSKSCPTLNHSNTIKEGDTPPEDRRACKVCA